MDDRGNIKEFASENEARYAGYTTALNAAEAAHLSQITEMLRPMELAWFRFKTKRIELGRKPSIYEHQAFLAGWQAKP